MSEPFHQIQYAFAAHIRNPALNPRPADVEARRMKIYNDLFYNNVEDFMSGSFPVLRTIMSDDGWHRLIRTYFHHHKAKTPLFPEMPREFLYYLEQEYQPAEDDFPFMLELAHYEWAELALSLLEHEHPQTGIPGTSELPDTVPSLSPLAWVLSYHYPVQNIGPDFLPEQPGEQPTFLLLYRDLEDEVHFMELNPLTAHLLQRVKENKDASCKDLIQNIADELDHPNPTAVINGGLEILHDLFHRHVLYPLNQT
ncbi:MAG: putative DNA-binding domain-containing protein [Gammaproteobacteria bacterium]|nr:putative DNA-binding domain-containing protein [Gammaproteobacteria bacterium]MDH5651399.1 putative DNA-binding domain-containing protein [Gammaproteobacteria bacterium]